MWFTIYSCRGSGRQPVFSSRKNRMSVSAVFPPLDITEEQALVRQTARNFARNELAPLAKSIDEHEKIPPQVWSRLAELQLLGVPIPEQYGGMGLNSLCNAT